VVLGHHLPNVPAVTWCNSIGGWQVPREGVQVARARNTNVLTIADIEKIGIEKSAEIALDLAEGADAVYHFVRRRFDRLRLCSRYGWPEPGGSCRPRALNCWVWSARRGFAVEVVEVSPPYDTPTSPR